MLITTHFLIVVIILLLANNALGGISLAIIILSFISGAFIDLDHVIFHYKESINWMKLLLTRKLPKEQRGSAYLHSVFREPWFSFVLLGFSGIIFLFYKKVEIFIPALSLGAHIFCDALMAFDNLLLWPFSDKKFRGSIACGALWEVIVSIVLMLFIFIFL